MVSSEPWGILTLLAAVTALVFLACSVVYVRRLENRRPEPLGEVVGAHKAILTKVRTGEPMSCEEFDYASELIADARSPLALTIPATLFCLGFFYIVGCLYELHVHGGGPSFRTFVGGIPMLNSMNVAAQLRRVARLEGRLRDVDVRDPGEPVPAEEPAAP